MGCSCSWAARAAHHPRLRPVLTSNARPCNLSRTHSFMAELHRQFEEAGGTTAFHSRAEGGNVGGPVPHRLLVRDVHSGEATELAAGLVVNATGLHAQVGSAECRMRCRLHDELPCPLSSSTPPCPPAGCVDEPGGRAARLHPAPAHGQRQLLQPRRSMCGAARRLPPPCLPAARTWHGWAGHTLDDRPGGRGAVWPRCRVVRCLYGAGKLRLPRAAAQCGTHPPLHRFAHCSMRPPACRRHPAPTCRPSRRAGCPQAPTPARWTTEYTLRGQHPSTKPSAPTFQPFPTAPCSQLTRACGPRYSGAGKGRAAGAGPAAAHVHRVPSTADPARPNCASGDGPRAASWRF